MRILYKLNIQKIQTKKNSLKIIKEKYKNFLYIDCMPAEKKNVAFYEKYGFSVMENGTAMQICNYCNS